MRPSRLPPILMRCSWARPCVIATRFSLRVSAQHSARPVFLAAQARVIVSRSMPILAPNPPPTSGDHHADLLGRHAQGAGQDEPAHLRVLRTGPDGQLAVLVADGRGPPLHREAGDPLVDDVLLDDHLAGVERRVVGRHRVRDRDVGAGRREQQGLVGDGGRRSQHHRQRLVVHGDQVGCVLALVAAIGNHHRDRLADEPHRVDRQQGLGPRAAERRRAAVPLAGARRRRGQVVHVGDGQHGDHAGLGEGRAGVDAGDARMGHRAAHERDARRPV